MAAETLPRQGALPPIEARLYHKPCTVAAIHIRPDSSQQCDVRKTASVFKAEDVLVDVFAG